MVNCLWNSELTYYEGYESFCYQNSLRLILESYGVDYAPLYINASLGLNMAVKNDSDIEFSFGENARSFLPEYASKDNRIYYLKGTDPLDVFKENVKMVNDNNTAIIVGADLYYLPYLEYYHKKHGAHTFILCGADLENDTVQLVDWYEPWFHKGEMYTDEFILARNSENPKDEHIYSGTPIRNNWTEISRDGWDAVPSYLISTVLGLSREQYFETSDNNGCLCFRRIVELLGKFANDENDHRSVMKSVHMGLFDTLKRFKFLKQYLQIAQGYNCNSEKAIEKIDKYVAYFDSTLMLVYKTTMVNSSKTFERVIGRLKELDRLHEEIYEALKETEKAMN